MIVGCGGPSSPGAKVIEVNIADKIPGQWIVKNLKIESEANVGDEVDQEWKAKFKAILSNKEDHYSRVKEVFKSVHLLKKVVNANSEVVIYGKAITKKVSGKWVTTFDLDDLTQLQKLQGRPKAMFPMGLDMDSKEDMAKVDSIREELAAVMKKNTEAEAKLQVELAQKRADSDREASRIAEQRAREKLIKENEINAKKEAILTDFVSQNKFMSFGDSINKYEVLWDETPSEGSYKGRMMYTKTEASYNNDFANVEGVLKDGVFKISIMDSYKYALEVVKYCKLTVESVLKPSVQIEKFYRKRDRIYSTEYGEVTGDADRYDQYIKEEQETAKRLSLSPFYVAYYEYDKGHHYHSKRITYDFKFDDHMVTGGEMLWPHKSHHSHLSGDLFGDYMFLRTTKAGHFFEGDKRDHHRIRLKYDARAKSYVGLLNNTELGLEIPDELGVKELKSNLERSKGLIRSKTPLVRQEAERNSTDKQFLWFKSADDDDRFFGRVATTYDWGVQVIQGGLVHDHLYYVPKAWVRSAFNDRKSPLNKRVIFHLDNRANTWQNIFTNKHVFNYQTGDEVRQTMIGRRFLEDVLAQPLPLKLTGTEEEGSSDKVFVLSIQEVTKEKKFFGVIGYADGSMANCEGVILQDIMHVRTTNYQKNTSRRRATSYYFRLTKSLRMFQKCLSGRKGQLFVPELQAVSKEEAKKE
jgi:hypothetical protein